MRKRITGLLLSAGFLLPLGAQGVARVVAPPTFGPSAQTPGAQNAKTMVTTKPGEVTASVMTPQGVMESTTLQMKGDNALIVQLRDDPILNFRGTLSGLGLEERKLRLRFGSRPGRSKRPRRSRREASSSTRFTTARLPKRLKLSDGMASGSIHS